MVGRYKFSSPGELTKTFIVSFRQEYLTVQLQRQFACERHSASNGDVVLVGAAIGEYTPGKPGHMDRVHPRLLVPESLVPGIELPLHPRERLHTHARLSCHLAF